MINFPAIYIANGTAILLSLAILLSEKGHYVMNCLKKRYSIRWLF